MIGLACFLWFQEIEHKKAALCVSIWGPEWMLKF